MADQSQLVRLKRKYRAGYMAKIKNIDQRIQIRIQSSGQHLYTFYPDNIIYNPQRSREKGNSIVYDNGEAFLSGQKCTIKQIPVDFDLKLKYVVRQINTYQIIKKKKHPNLIQVIDIFFIDNIDTVIPQEQVIAKLMEKSFYFIMKKQKKQIDTLRSYININRKKTEEQLLYIFSQIVDGLCYLHDDSEGKPVIIHRDLKPQNMLIYQLQGKKRIRLIDFGLSRFISLYTKSRYQKPPSKQQRFTFGVGSYSYMPPQVIIQKNYYKYDQKCDLWSLGSICYELITSTKLITRQKQKQQDVKFKQRVDSLDIQKKIRDATKLTSQYTQIWKQILEDCLQFQPKKRKSVKKIRQYLNNHLSQLLVEIKSNDESQQRIDEFGSNDQNNQENIKLKQINSKIEKTMKLTEKQEKIKQIKKQIQTPYQINPSKIIQLDKIQKSKPQNQSISSIELQNQSSKMLQIIDSDQSSNIMQNSTIQEKLLNIRLPSQISKIIKLLITNHVSYKQKPSKIDEIMKITKLDIFRIEFIISKLIKNKLQHLVTKEVIKLCLLSIQRICIMLYEVFNNFKTEQFFNFIETAFKKKRIEANQYMNTILCLKIDLNYILRKKYKNQQFHLQNLSYEELIRQQDAILKDIEQKNKLSQCQ